jgi:glycosidase
MTEQARPIFGQQPGSVDTPEWVRDAVFYQILPDRFAKSDALPKPGGLESWSSDPTQFGYKGGDLIGVVEHLDYLTDLGVTAIYFCPVFQSASNHRYHTHDYFTIDPLLGGQDAFDRLLEACHERGIRVVLDGVFNHCSRGFFQFNDILENGRYSPWLDWFTVHNLPLDAYDHSRPPAYDAWFDLHALPKFNTGNPQVREFIMQVGEHWMRQGIDGWRLDVPNEITTPGFWQEFRSRIKAVNPDAWICGEIWDNAEQWLQGDQFDAVMNYQFTEAALAFAGRHRVVKALQDDRGYSPWPGIDAVGFADRMVALLSRHDWNVTLSQMNLLGSHDTPRAITLMGGGRRSLELAAMLLFTFPGAPTIYYGDEIGLEGGLPDWWARKSFPWDGLTWDLDVRNLYRQLIGLRKRLASLRRGTWQVVDTRAGCLAVLRRHELDSVLLVINTDETEGVVRVDDVRPLLVHASIGDRAMVRTTGNGAEFALPARSASMFAMRDA